MAFSATYFSNSKTKSNFRLINILVMHKKVKTIILSVHLINIDSHLTRKKKEEKNSNFSSIATLQKKKLYVQKKQALRKVRFPW